MNVQLPIDTYAYWHAELASKQATQFVATIDNPAIQSRDTNEPVDGFWRIMGAKTKADYPVAVWAGDAGPVVQIGNKVHEDSGAFDDFLTSTFLKCAAVTEEQYRAAVASGFWWDKKPARTMSETEKAGLPDIAADAGGNQAPIFDVLAEQIEALLAKARLVKDLATQEAADDAAALAGKIKLLYDRAEVERVKEKAPHDLAAKAVQAKWTPMIGSGEAARKYLMSKVNTYLANVQAELDRQAAEERRKAQEAAEAERQRLQAIEDERVRIANEEAEQRVRLARAEAEEAGEPEPELVAEVIEAVKVEVYVPPVAVEKAMAGSEFGRATSVRMKTIAIITDPVRLVQHFTATADMDFLDYLQSRADKAVRAKVVLPGVESKKVPA